MPLHPPGADPARTMEEDLEQLVTLDRLGFEEAWVGEHITAMWENIPKPGLYEGRHWRFRVPEPQADIGLSLHLRPYQRPHPPIGVAGVSAKSETLVLAGERGYIPMSINFVPPRILRSHWASVED